MFQKKERADCEVLLKVHGWESEYPSVQLMLRYLKRKTGSDTSRMKYLGEFARFLNWHEIKSPEDYLAMGKETCTRLLQETSDTMNDKGASIHYINTFVSDVSLFLRVNGVKDLDIQRIHQPARYRKKPEYIPTKEEVFAMAGTCGSSLAGMRDKAMILCMYGSGLRNSTIRAVLYGDVKAELEAGAEVVKVPVYPEMKKVVPGACKGNIPYFTFLPREAVAAVKLYLKQRVAAYGSIPDSAPLFSTEDTKMEREQRNLNPITKDKLRKVVHLAAKRAGVARWKDLYPHCLRKAAESFFRGPTTDEVRLDVKTQEFLMGHILPGSQDPYFDKTKAEELRERYSRLVFRPEAAFDRRRVLGTMNRQFLKLANYTDEEIQALGDLAELTDPKLQDLVRRKQGLPAAGRQKVVPLSELERHINEGWEYVTTFNGDRAIVKLPG